MSSFECLVYRITVEPHPDADRLEVARVMGYTCVVGLNQFKTGDLAAYIPEQAVVPDDVLKELGLVGMLAGKKKNRVKAMMFRGIFSQGLLYPIVGKKLRSMNIHEKDDVMSALGITKYVPEVPVQFAGELEHMDGIVPYDIENIKKYPDIIRGGEPVTITEKIHGILCRITCHDGHVHVSSKGMGNQGFVFTPDTDNTYMQMCKKYKSDILTIAGRTQPNGCTIFTEVYGKKIQDLNYNSEPDMRVFDICVPGVLRNCVFLSTDAVLKMLRGLDLKYVPIAYRGPYSKMKLIKLVNGKSLVPGSDNVMEGVVVRPDMERTDPNLGRVVLKAVAKNYLLRKGGTEYE